MADTPCDKLKFPLDKLLKKGKGMYNQQNLKLCTTRSCLLYSVCEPLLIFALNASHISQLLRRMQVIACNLVIPKHSCILPLVNTLRHTVHVAPASAQAHCATQSIVCSYLHCP